ncbi:MAG: cobalt ECF transporter T component CbiQ [Chloroflexota bacterium]
MATKDSHFVGRTLREVTHGLEATLSADDTARLPGLLQALDPRGKVLWFLGLLVATSFLRQLPVLLGMCLAVHAVATLGRLRAGFFLRRVWVFVPFFALVVALPAIFNVITPGRLVVELVDLGAPWQWGIFSLPQHIGLSEQGLRSAATLVLRVGTSVALAVLLVSTTRWATLLRALEALRLPSSLVLILSMTYRYVVLFLRTADAMFLARESRRVGRLSGPAQRHWVASAGGALLGKSFHLSGEVYLAMLSRGFRGEVRLVEQFKWRRIDWLAGAGTVALVAIALVADRVVE